MFTTTFTTTFTAMFAAVFAAIVAAVLAGCKIEIQVPEGGSVASVSGAYTCQAGQHCEIGVHDVYFDETFIAQPSPGYEFLLWKKAPLRLCGGKADSCPLNTTGFPGNDNLLAFLESDTSFYLEPVFRKTVAGEYKLEYRESDRPRVIDSNGRTIGSYLGVSEYGSPWDIQVNFKGLPDNYTLSVLLTGSAPLPPDFYHADIAYFGEACEDRFNPMALTLPNRGFDKTRVYMRSPIKLYIPDPNGRTSTRSYKKFWESGSLNCGRSSTPEMRDRVHPLLPTNLELHFPLTVEGTDIVIFQDPQLVF